MQSMWWRKLNFKDISRKILKALFFAFKFCLVLIGIVIALFVGLILLLLLFLFLHYNFSSDVTRCNFYDDCKEGLMIKTYLGVSQVSKENCKGKDVIMWDDKKKSCFYDEYVVIKSWKKD